MRFKILQLVIIIVFTACSKEYQEVVLKGRTVDVTTDLIMLLKPYDDMRFDEIIEIPVENGSFEYRTTIENPEGYYLLLGEARENGGGAFMPLFLEEGEINLTIHNENDFKKNLVKGGKLNRELSEYMQQVEAQEFQSWEEQKEWRNRFIEEHVNLVSYFLLVQDLTNGWEIENPQDYKQRHKKLAAAFPDHPYSEIVEKLIDGHSIKPGKKFIDFSAPDIEGNVINLSEQIKGKVSLINLWATWCAPCIKKSREIIPVVEEYQEKGFMVIGVAGEFKSTENLEAFLKRKEFPWLNLVELDRENDLWARYGIPNSGGGMFLIDRDGTILIKNPSREELETSLAALLP